MKQNKNLVILACVIFFALAGFWGGIALKGLQGETDTAELFSAVYGVMALFGGLVGLTVSRHWGGVKSLIGRAVVCMSLGLLAQAAGQAMYSMYTYLWHQEIPYPSWGDVGYFGSVIFYILGAWMLIKALSVKSASESSILRKGVVVIPVLLLSLSYYVFLRDYSFDWSNPLTVLLDFGYPLGQAFYISLALVAWVLSRKYLGGVMRPVILFLILALVLQYAADFTFLYQVNRDTWQTAGGNELMYLIAYFAMTLSLLEFGTVLNRLSGRKQKV